MTGFKRHECEGELSLISIAPHFHTRKSSDAFDLSSEGNLIGGEPLVRRVPFNEVVLERPWFGIKTTLFLKRTKLTGCQPVSPHRK